MAGGSTQWRGRSVISKVVSLLDAFSPDAPELSLADMARITGLPVSTTYRLASELVTWGGLERADGRTGYRIGARMAELGSLAPRSADLRAIARPFMQDLCVATHESVYLAVLDGQHAVCLHTVAPDSDADGRSWRSPRLPLHASGAGKVLLAHAPDQLVSDLVAAGLRRWTAHTVVDPDRLREELREVRDTGVGYERDEMAPDHRSAAAPIVDATDAVVAALAVVARTGGDVCRLGPAVRTAATSVSRSLRFPGPAPRRELPERR